MELSDCASKLELSYSAITDGSTRIEGCLGEQHLATVMGPAVMAGTASAASIERHIESNAVLTNLLDSAPEGSREALQSAVVALGVNLSKQSATAAVAAAQLEVANQVAAPIATSINLQRKAVNEAAAAGKQVQSISEAEKSGLSIDLIEVRNDYDRVTTAIVAGFTEIRQLESELQTAKAKGAQVVADATLSFPDRSSQISEYKVLTDFMKSRVRELYSHIHCIVAGQAPDIHGLDDNNIRRQTKDLVDLQIPSKLFEERRGAELAENLESYVRGREDCFGTITPEIRRISRDLDSTHGLFWAPVTLRNSWPL